MKKTMEHVDPNDPNVDIDVHPAPVGLWQRVAVCGLWSSKEKIRRSWPDAAVVGPLRTMRGIDLLMRSLLANPQIRVVIVDGPDLRPDVTEALFNVWSEHGWLPGDTDGSWGKALDDEGLVAALIETRLPRNVKLLRLDEWDTSGHGAKGNLLMHVIDEDRPGGAIFLPAPKPPPLDVLPHGDPGQRVVGDTLAEVWPRALAQAMRFGRKAPTQYGETREILALTSVIRDPRATLDEFMARLTRDIDTGEPVTLYDPHPVLGFTYQDVETYYRQLVGLDPKGDRAYSYGSRMRGVAEEYERIRNDLIAHARKALAEDQAEWPTEPEKWRPYPVILNANPPVIPDQIALVQKLLSEKPDTRAAYLTPWRPEEDSGVEAGRPCLVSVWFRTTGGEHEPSMPGREGDSSPDCPRCGFEVGQSPSAARGCARNPRTLHLVAAFRSHDLFAGHAHNLAALCMWLVEEAKRLQVEVGTLTVTSYSAHVYARDYAAALDIAKNPTPMISWDQRSSWRIRTKPGSRRPVLVAEALTPGEEGGDEVIATFEAPSPGALRLAIIRSGLVTDVGAACWLGSEIERVWATRGTAACA